MKIKKNLLIICEGQSTEPNYFHDLRNMLIDRNIDYNIVIRPKPPQQSKEDIEALAEFRLRKGGRKRTVTNINVDESDIVEEIYKAQPTRYVREAQLGLLDGTFEEAWAIYDLNGHSDHENAYNLSRTLINSKKIHIGFSSISFETWVLWHFEQNITPFARSQCRTGKKLHDCGQGTNTSDCQGNLCVTGYLKTHGYISSDKDVKSIRFNELQNDVYNALTNAYEIRQTTISGQSEVPYYKFIPFSTVDRLVFKMLHIPIDYQWVTIDEVLIPHFNTKVGIVKNIVNIMIENTSDRIQIINLDFVVLVNVRGETKPVLERNWIQPIENKSFSIDLNDHKEFGSTYIAFKLADSIYQITELPLY